MTEPSPRRRRGHDLHGQDARTWYAGAVGESSTPGTCRVTLLQITPTPAAVLDAVHATFTDSSRFRLLVKASAKGASAWAI
jgi:hypothetical protein